MGEIRSPVIVQRLCQQCMPEQQYNLIVTENKMSLDAALERDIARVIAETPKGSTYKVTRSKRGTGSNSHYVRNPRQTKVQASKSNVWRNITTENLGQNAARIWDAYDKNKNRQLDGDEVFRMARDMLTAMPEMSQLFMDDAITADEMCDNINDYATTFTYMIFDYADTDKNKVITKDEWSVFCTSM